MTEIILIAHNIRSLLNVGSLLRSADGFGLQKVFLTGYTPYPAITDDPRLPHVSAKATRQIHKTALGAEQHLQITVVADVMPLLRQLQAQNFSLVALEQAPQAVALNQFQPSAKIALLVGREVEGVEPEILAAMDTVVEIPMYGQKESFNVAVAGGIALYHLAVAAQFTSITCAPETVV